MTPTVTPISQWCPMPYNDALQVEGERGWEHRLTIATDGEAGFARHRVNGGGPYRISRSYAGESSLFVRDDLIEGEGKTKGKVPQGWGDI